MQRNLSKAILPVLFLLVSMGAVRSAPAQEARLTQPVNEHALVTLRGTVHPLANAANDRGAVSPDMQLERLQLVLKRSPQQEAALRQLLQDMHTPGTATFHKWLTPEQFGQQFGPSDQDVQTIESWLETKGFKVLKVNRASRPSKPPAPLAPSNRHFIPPFTNMRSTAKSIMPILPTRRYLSPWRPFWVALFH